MANEKYYPVQTRKSDLVMRHGIFSGNGAGNGVIPAGLWEQLIVSATHTATGTYAIVLDKSYPQLKHVVAFLVNGTTASLEAFVTAIDVTAKTATIVTSVGGVATDMGTNDTLYLKLSVRNSGRNK
ncbi:MAG TPA: hypothetical protein VKR80_07395 [Candidatus Limnocylindria bacterium]|nr:hypothetical protein [Candidatus Limnocylindria bacterium]